MSTESKLMPASFIKRLAVIFYDFLLLLALWIAWLFILLPIIQTLSPEMITEGKTVGHPAITASLLALWFLFYGWCWVKGNQTPAMKVWRVKLIKTDHSKFNWKDAFVRFFTSFLGLANLPLLLPNIQNGWHDYLSNSQLIQLPKD